MSFRAGFPSDIGQANPWLQTFVAGRWFASSQPDREWHGRRPRRVRALIGQRMTTTTRHAGTHDVCEPPHASDDTRLDLSSHRQAVRLFSEGSDSRSIRAVRLRPQLNSGSRFRTERTVSGTTPETAVADRLWGRVASPDLLRGRTDRRPVRLDPGASAPPPGSSELPNHANTDSGRGDSTSTPSQRGHGARRTTSMKRWRPKRQALREETPATSGWPDGLAEHRL